MATVFHSAIGDEYEIDIDDDFIRLPLLFKLSDEHKFKHRMGTKIIKTELFVSQYNKIPIQTTFEDRITEKGYCYVYNIRKIEESEDGKQIVSEDTDIKLDYFYVIHSALIDAIKLNLIS